MIASVRPLPPCPPISGPSTPTRAAAAPGHPEHAADSVSLGVIDMRGENPPKVAFNTAQAALWSVDAAAQAASHGTFGVGGVLLGPHREVIAVSCNRVVADGHLADPTAHGERQLVDWYFEKVHQGESLPNPAECTIVSSLDPCMMCAGSILTAGFHVASTTLDTMAGVNYTADGTYPTVPAPIRQKAVDNFSYFGVEGKRDYQGPAIYGEHAVLQQELEQRSLDVFLKSVDQVRETIHGGGGPVQDLAGCQDAQVLNTLRKYTPQALSLKFKPGHPGPELAAPLKRAAEAARAAGGAYNAAALLDPHGNLVCLTAGKEGQSPVRTAFMELTRTWANVQAEAGPEGAKYLAPFRDCTVVTLVGPRADEPSVMEWGAYGSSVEGPLGERAEAGWQYILPQQSQHELETELKALPPLYANIIQPRIEQVREAALIEAAR